MAPHTDHPPEPPPTSSRRARGRLSVKFVLNAALVLLVAYTAGYYNVVHLKLSFPRWAPSRHKHVICRPPLPPLKNQVFDPGEYPLRQASEEFDASMKVFATQKGVDSVTVAIVTPQGSIFSKGYGARRANETGSRRGKVDENTIYRLASVSKLITVLELWILKERGALKWYVTSLRLPY